ncbi:hypothetical protein [Streptomyces sp. NPDC002845]
MSRPTRLRQLTVLAIGVTTAVALTACSAASGTDAAEDPSPSASATPQGVVTEQAAKQVLDTYENVNNKANSTRNAKLLGTVEAGQLYVQDQADYVQWKTWPKKKQKRYGSPFTYQSRTYYIPAAGTASWFAVEVTASSSKSRGLLFFDKVDGTYKMVMAFYEGDGESIPKIAVDRYGLATVVDPSKRVGTLAPDQLSPAYEDLFETGGTREGKKLTPTKLTKQAVRVYRDSEKSGTAEGHATKKFFAEDPASKRVYALKTANGAVLASFGTAHTQESLVKSQYRSSYELIPNEVQSLYSATRGALITDTYQGQVLAELTPTSARLTNSEWQHVDSR